MLLILATMVMFCSDMCQSAMWRGPDLSVVTDLMKSDLRVRHIDYFTLTLTCKYLMFWTWTMVRVCRIHILKNPAIHVRLSETSPDIAGHSDWWICGLCKLGEGLAGPVGIQYCRYFQTAFVFTGHSDWRIGEFSRLGYFASFGVRTDGFEKPCMC